MRRALILAVLASLAVAVPAEAAKTVNVPTAFRAVLPKVRAKTKVPILLPSSMRLDFAKSQKLYASGGGSRAGYDLELAGAPRCGGATACFAATFTAEKGAKLGYAPNVTLMRGLRGHYQPLSCGASCSPPSVVWILGGVRYEIQANALPGKRADLVAAANSAISAGKR